MVDQAQGFHTERCPTLDLLSDAFAADALGGLGSVHRVGEKWRVSLWVGRKLYGPRRDSEAEAEADLAGARELPRHGIAAYFQGLQSQAAQQRVSCSAAADPANEDARANDTHRRADELLRPGFWQAHRGRRTCITPWWQKA